MKCDNKIRNVLSQTFRSSNLVPPLEHFLTVLSLQQRSTEVALKVWACGKVLAVDVTILCYLQASTHSDA